MRAGEKRDALAPFARLHFAGHTATGAECQAAMEKAVGRPLKRGSVPWPLLRVVGLFNPLLREVVKMR